MRVPYVTQAGVVRFLSNESRSLELERKVGGKFLLKLNTGLRPIVNKYREGKVKRTLKRELKVPEIIGKEANGASPRRKRSVHQGNVSVNRAQAGEGGHLLRCALVFCPSQLTLFRCKMDECVAGILRGAEASCLFHRDEGTFDRWVPGAGCLDAGACCSQGALGKDDLYLSCRARVDEIASSDPS